MNTYLLHHLLRRAAGTHPDRPAVVDGERQVSYRELDELTDRLAGLLVDIGVCRGDRVGLYLDKSLEAVVGIYAALKAGAAYVPLDPQAPTSRLGYIAANCGIEVLLSSAARSDGWAGLVAAGADISSFVLVGDELAAVEAPPGSRLVVFHERSDGAVAGLPGDVTDDDLAYVLYTSGSTGQPKGVMLSHRNSLGFVRWAVEEFGLSCTDRLSSHAPLHFDLSILDLFGAAHAGAAVVLVPAEASVFPGEVTRFVERFGITVWYSVPSVLSMLVKRGRLEVGRMPSLRLVLFAGEVFPTPFLRRLMALVPHARFCNLYGPTETNVCTYYWVPELVVDDDRDIPIGRPITNVRTIVVGEELRTVRRGDPGELLVSGCTVMRGYWADEERTARLLVVDPEDPASGCLAYRTGDLVIEEDSGDYRFLGRRDNQIKSRGYRIELGEVETALHAHPAVLECAAVAVPDPMITNRVRAVVATQMPVTAAELSGFCATRLPAYMVPSEFDFRTELPRTSTGKIDRKGLAGANGGGSGRT